MDAETHEQLGRAYDLVEMIWNEGQPPEPDWNKLGAYASELAALAARFGGEA